MTLTLEKPEEEKLLRRVARSRGLAPTALVFALLQEAEAKLRQIGDTPDEDAVTS